MGDIAFNITKVVNLNKTINLDIDKNVDVNVNIDDLLATAEADAEGFGQFVLAEVDAYTYAREIPGNDGIIELSQSTVDALGNSSLFDLNGLVALNAQPLSVAQTLTANFIVPTPAPGDQIVPDVDDVNGGGKFEDLFPPPEPGDNVLPAPGFNILTNFILETEADTPAVILEGDLEVEYTLQQDFVIDFGVREIDIQPGEEGDPCNNCGVLTTAELTLTIPEDTIFLVNYENVGPGADPFNTPIEIEFLTFDTDGGDGSGGLGPEGGLGYFTFDALTYEVNEFVMELESLQDEVAGVSDWAFQAGALFPMCVDCEGGGDGEAFAYAESTTAIDLI